LIGSQSGINTSKAKASNPSDIDVCCAGYNTEFVPNAFLEVFGRRAMDLSFVNERLLFAITPRAAGQNSGKRRILAPNDPNLRAQARSKHDALRRVADIATEEIFGERVARYRITTPTPGHLGSSAGQRTPSAAAIRYRPSSGCLHSRVDAVSRRANSPITAASSSPTCACLRALLAKDARRGARDP
jgi:hypothetical protein